VALGGDTDYKYVWVATERGSARFFNTTGGTPWTVRFSVAGDILAVSTAASIGYLLSLQLDVRWKGRLEKMPIRWSEQIRVTTSDDSNATIFSREDVHDLLVLRPAIRDSRASATGRSVVEWEVPSHGPGNGLVHYKGPDASEWLKVLDCPTAAITDDGERVIAIGDLKAHEAADGASSCDNRALFVFNRDGQTLQSWSDRRRLLVAEPEGHCAALQS
jgi:hypothetical protein